MTFDVGTRLDQGRLSVSHTQTYVAACHTLGYRHPDLTANGAQVIAWYDTEDGTNLAVLDADCARLRSAATAAEEALRLERDAAAALAAAWSGESGSAATDFVDQHCAAATAVTAELRAAADSCTALRDALWRLVGDKVNAAVAIDDRRVEVRPVWLSAAQTVMSGATDRAEATDVVTHQITPYVDADIRTDWLGAMRAATASVAAAYDDALNRLNALAPAVFDVPGPLDPPMPDPPHTTAARAPAPPAVTAPAASAGEPPAAPTAWPTAPAAPTPAPAPVAADPPVPPSPSAQAPGIGGAMPASMPGAPTAPDLGGGLSGLAGQIGQAIDGLFSGQPDPPADPALDEPQPADDPPIDDAKDPELQDESPDQVIDDSADVTETGAVAPPSDEATVEDAPAAEPPAAEPPAAEPPAPEPPDPEPAPEPTPEQAAEPTPCQIAADELPQVGQ